MKKDANTILLFTEHRAAIDYLSDEDAGKLIKALFAYVDEGQLPDFNGPMMSLFTYCLFITTYCLFAATYCQIGITPCFCGSKWTAYTYCKLVPLLAVYKFHVAVFCHITIKIIFKASLTTSLVINLP